MHETELLQEVEQFLQSLLEAYRLHGTNAQHIAELELALAELRVTKDRWLHTFAKPKNEEIPLLPGTRIQ